MRSATLICIFLAPAALAEAPLATVNGEPITRKQLVSEFQQRHGGHAKFLAGEVEIRKALDALVDRRLLLQEARRLGLHQEPAIAGPIAELEEKEAVGYLYKSEVNDKAKVTDAEVKAFFETKTEDLFAVRQVVVKTRPEAVAVLAELQAGGDFEKLAREKSTAHSKIYGGLLGNLGWGSMDAAWEEVAYRLEKGKLSGVLASKDGFEILRLEETKKVPRPEYAKAEKRIRGILEGRKLEARRAAFQQELWAKYAVQEPKVAWSLDALHKAVASKAQQEVGVWKGGKLTLSGFADRINLDLVAKLPPDHHQEQLENLRHELVRQEVVKLEVAARKLTRAPEVAEPVEVQRAEAMENKLFDEYILKGVALSPEEEKKYFEDHQSDFTRPQRWRLSQIVVPTEEKAKETQKKLVAGAKFESLAKTLSTDPESAKKGGDLGWVTEAQTPPDFSAVLALKAGEVSAPIKSTYGFHLIKVAELAPPTVPPFEEVKEEVHKVALRKKMEDKRNFWVRKLRGAAHIVISDPAVKAFAKEASL